MICIPLNTSTIDLEPVLRAALPDANNPKAANEYSLPFRFEKHPASKSVSHDRVFFATFVKTDVVENGKENKVWKYLGIIEGA